jgi:AbrB family looped-hinge helix DNA binding protein
VCYEFTDISDISENLKMERKVTDSMAKNINRECCCHLEAVITIDARGQVVIPKELRTRAGIRDGDRLIVMSTMEDGKVCCISMMKADRSDPMVKEMLGPVLKGISKE